MTKIEGERASIGIHPDKLLAYLEDTNVFAFLDNWGPSKVIHVYEPESGMQGILIIDNTTQGPGWGGLRFEKVIKPREVFNRARTNTLACALAGVRLGGAAAGIRLEGGEIDKNQLVRAFARCVSPCVPDCYVAAPDVNTGQAEMRVFAEEVGDRRGATGKPVEMGGIPYELGVMGLGAGVALESFLQLSGEGNNLPGSLEGATVALQGFECVGAAVARYCVNKGAKIVALSDDWGAVYDPTGIDLGKALKFSCATSERQSLAQYKVGHRTSQEEILKIECDALVLCGGRGMVTEEIAHMIQAKCVVEGPDAPLTPVAEMVLTRRGVPVLPDLLTLSAAAIASYAELERKSCEEAFSLIGARIKSAVTEIVESSKEPGVPFRRVAKELARERILRAMEGGK
ncbi:MAG: Glu/Leu/Phe/Val dehydrogenase dimerization domain-containing protein [Thermoplasmata archaeon]